MMFDGEAKRIVDALIAERDQARAEARRLYKIAEAGWHSARLLAIQYGAVRTEDAADDALEALVQSVSEKK